MLKDGEIIATGTSSQLIENMQGKVGEVVCTLSDVADLQGKVPYRKYQAEKRTVWY